MKALTSFIFFISLFFLSSCVKKKDTTKEKAILSYLLNCTGGSLSACQNSCAVTCGIDIDSNLTPSNLPCVSNCQSACSSSCNSINLLIVLSRK